MRVSHQSQPLRVAGGAADVWGRAAKDTVILAGSALVMAALQIVFRLLATHDLSVASYGRVATLLAVFNFLLLVASFGVPAATARLTARAATRSGWSQILFASAGAVLLPTVFASVALAVAAFLITHSAGLTVASALGLVPMVVSVVLAGFLRGRGRVWGAAAVQPANALFQLLPLVVLAAASRPFGLGAVVLSFYVGNVAACAVAVLQLRFALRADNVALGGERLGDDVSARAVVKFGAWLTLATGAVTAFTVVPRLWLARTSFAEVAYFDVALLVYSIPQRIGASITLALIPLASRANARAQRILMIAPSDVLLAACAFSAVDLTVWRTHAVRTALTAIGLRQYAPVEPLLLILLLAAPAELAVAANAGILQALGRSRALAIRAVGVFILALLVLPASLLLGTRWLAAAFVIEMWLFYLLIDDLGRSCGVERANVLASALSTRLRARAAATFAAAPASRSTKTR